MAPARKNAGKPAAQAAKFERKPSGGIDKGMDKKKHSDMMKKRKRRGMTNELIKQLQDLLPPVSWTRCMHETLQEAAKEMRRVMSSSAASPSSTFSEASSDSSPPPSASPFPEMRVDDSMLRRGMMMSREHLRLAIVTSDLHVHDASDSFSTLFLGRPAATGIEVQGGVLRDILVAEVQTNLIKAMKYLVTSEFDFEENRKLTIGIYVTCPSGELLRFPVLLTPLPVASPSDEALFMMQAFKPLENQDCAVFSFIESLLASQLGSSMRYTESSPLSWEESNRVDAEGERVKSGGFDMDPFVAMSMHMHRMVVAGTFEEFDQYMQSHATAVCVVWNQIRDVFFLSEDEMRQFKHETFDSFYKKMVPRLQSKVRGSFRTYRGNVACWQTRLNGVPTMEMWMRQPNATAPARMTYTTMMKMCNDESVDVTLCEGNMLSWQLTEPMKMPGPDGSTISYWWSATFDCNVGNQMAEGCKCAIIDSEIFHTIKRLQQVDTAPPVDQPVGDFALFCHLIGVCSSWRPSCTFTNAQHLCAPRFDGHHPHVSCEESLASQPLMLTDDFARSSSTDSSGSFGLSWIFNGSDVGMSAAKTPPLVDLGFGSTPGTPLSFMRAGTPDQEEGLLHPKSVLGVGMAWPMSEGSTPRSLSGRLPILTESCMCSLKCADDSCSQKCMDVLSHPPCF